MESRWPERDWRLALLGCSYFSMFLKTSEIHAWKQSFAVKIPSWLWSCNYSFSFKIVQNQIRREMCSFCWTARKYYLLMAPVLWSITIQENPPNTVLVRNVLFPWKVILWFVQALGDKLSRFSVLSWIITLFWKWTQVLFFCFFVSLPSPQRKTCLIQNTTNKLVMGRHV